MEPLGTLNRIDVGGALSRRTAAAAVPAADRAGAAGDGHGRERGSSLSIVKDSASETNTAAAHVKAAAARREVPEPPPAVQVDEFYEKRIVNGRGGLAIDLVYKSSGLRVGRLIGRDDGETRDEAARGSGDSPVAPNAALRAYRTVASDESRATTQITG